MSDCKCRFCPQCVYDGGVFVCYPLDCAVADEEGFYGPGAMRCPYDEKGDEHAACED